MLGTERLQACQRMWHALPHRLEIKEYHSPERLRNALERTLLYKRIMQRLKIKWIRLKLSHPLLLGLQEGRNQAKEQKVWIDIKVNASFYPQQSTPSEVPWHVREATRAMNDLHMDD